MNYHMCPVCFFDKMEEPASDYNICVCCGTEFGNDDAIHSHKQLRAMWIMAGAKWFFRHPPLMWNPWGQLAVAKEPLPYTAQVSFSGVTNLTFGSEFAVPPFTTTSLNEPTVAVAA